MSHSTRRVAAVLAAALALAAVAGCGGSGKSNSSASSGGSSSGSGGPITVGLALLPPKMTFIGFYVAQDEGFFKKNGLNIKLEGFNDGVKSLRAAASGSVDMGATSSDDVIAAALQGSGIKAIWSYAMPLDTTVIANDKVKTPADLRGKNLGITDPGGFSDVQIRAVLAQAGVPANQTHIISLPDRSAFVPSIVSGRIDAAPFHADDGYAVEAKDPKLHVISSLYKVLPKWWYSSVAVTQDWAKTHGDVIKRFITAMDEADRWIYTHKAQTVAIGVKYTQEPQAAVSKAYDFLAKANEWTTNQGLEQDLVMSTMQYEHKIGVIPKVPTYGQVVDRQFADAVVAKIGKDSKGY